MLLAGDDHARAAIDPAHPVFRMVANKAHPDLQVLERVINPKTGKLFKEILVDQVRYAEEAMHATAARGGRKVLLVDPADELKRPVPTRCSSCWRSRRPAWSSSWSASGPACCRARSSRAAPSFGWRRCRRDPCSRPRAAGARALRRAPSGPGSGRARLDRPGARAGGAGWLERYADLLGKLVAGARQPRGTPDARQQARAGTDGQGFRATADLIAAVLRRVAALQAGPRAGRRAGPPARRDLLAALAAGRGLDHWVAMWDKLTALAGRVDAVNLDPLQTLLQIVQAICGADPEAELSIA